MLHPTTRTPPQVPWHAAVQAFLHQPSLLTRRPELPRQRVQQLVQIPGLGRDRLKGALVSMPALLFLDPEVVALRWQLMQQVRGSCLGGWWLVEERTPLCM